MDAPTLLTVAQFSQKHPAFPNGGLRYRIFNEHQNGLAESGAIIRNGRRVLIDEAKFFDWVLSSDSQLIRPKVVTKPHDPLLAGKELTKHPPDPLSVGRHSDPEGRVKP